MPSAASELQPGSFREESTADTASPSYDEETEITPTEISKGDVKDNSLGLARKESGVSLELQPAVASQSLDSFPVEGSPISPLFFRCSNCNVEEVEAISGVLLSSLATAVVLKRKRDLFPKPVGEVTVTSRKELCEFLDTLADGDVRLGSRKLQSGIALAEVDRAASFQTRSEAFAANSLQSRSFSEKSAASSSAEQSTEQKGQGSGEMREPPTAENVAALVRRTLSSASVKPRTAVEVLARHDTSLLESGAFERALGDTSEVQFQQPEHSAEEEWQHPALQLTPFVQNLLDPFLSRQHTLLSRLSSSMGGEATQLLAVGEASGEIQNSGLWGPALRKELARVLILRWDMGCVAHCGETFQREQALSQHQTACPFRTVPCESSPCPVILPLIHRPLHNEDCPFKAFPCPQGCQEAVPRREIQTHCSTVCPLRIVPCPFASLPGSSCPSFPQRELEGHLKERVVEHQMLLLRSAVASQQTIANLMQHFTILEKAQELNEKASELEVRSVQLQTHKTDQRVSALERQVTAVTQEWRQHQAAIKRETDALRKQVTGLLNAAKGQAKNGGGC